MEVTDPQEKSVDQASREVPVEMDPQVHAELQANLDHQDPQDQLAQLELMVNQDSRERPAPQVLAVEKAPTAKEERKENPEQVDLQDQPDRKVPMASLAQLDPQDHPVHQESQARPVHREKKDSQDHQVPTPSTALAPSELAVLSLPSSRRRRHDDAIKNIFFCSFVVFTVYTL